ncbi:hypothetical protein [Methylocystis echinoides]|uniref:Uncharacterized protein n=1 Tax=Methylocystis echinoides TaxID=29468 RepID=A0A9W6GRK8_9HYPH|nr:hypothetical protein [Methylocystis echinoides]GLI91787.1 hypothetical protein LMG27198_07790 [Methylocystis echinoides]
MTGVGKPRGAPLSGDGGDARINARGPFPGGVGKNSQGAWELLLTYWFFEKNCVQSDTLGECFALALAGA